MKDDKIRFIMGLLTNPSTTIAQKERINKLLSAEKETISLSNERDVLTENDGSKLLNIEDRIKKILLKYETTESSYETLVQTTDLKKLPRPKETRDFLDTLFKGEEGYIKNTTHTFNSEYIDHDEFIAKCKEQYDDALKKYPNVPTYLEARVRKFLFSENPKWFIRDYGMVEENGRPKKIPQSLGWSNPEFIEWYKKKRTHPCDDSEYNNKMIIPFKDSIEIRTDDSSVKLKTIIKKINKSVFGSLENLEIDREIDQVHFLTDTDTLYCGISYIFNNIKRLSQESKSDRIHISCKMRVEEYAWVITICHVGTKTQKNAEDKNFAGGDIREIKKTLYGLCNYDIISEFGNGMTYRKPILTDKKGDEKPSLINENVEGFTHVLKFY